MADNTVQVSEIQANTVTPYDIINSVTVAETTENEVTVVAATFINDQGASSKIFYGTTSPDTSVGEEGDFWINISLGQLYGPKGPDGWPSAELYLRTKRYIHDQPVPATTWNVVHDLGGRPSVTVVDSAGTVVHGEVSYSSDSEIQLNFSAPFSGKAYLT